MTRTSTRRQILTGSLVVAAGALSACKDVSFPGLEKLDPNATAHATSAPTPVASATAPVAAPASSNPAPILQEAPFGGAFDYEVQKTKAVWQAELTPEQYDVLRAGRTEPRHSHPYVTQTEPGTYHCAGCDLAVYGSEHKTVLEVGWVFFEQGLDNAALLGMDAGRIEAHCRRCGGHFGHVLVVPAAGRILHCINGNALKFVSATA